MHIWSKVFQTEENVDKLLIGDQEHSGTKNISQYLEGHFDITFVSDFSITSNGFELEWTCADPIVQTGTNGTIELESYGKNLIEMWNVRSSCQNVLVEADRLNIGDEEMLVVDGIEFTSYQLVKNGTFDVQFTTESEINGTGFDIKWKCLNPGNHTSYIACTL